MLNEEDRDLYALIFTGPFILLGIFASVLAGASGWIITKGHVATSWLIPHNILGPADQAAIPILAAGLDLPRCVLLAAILILLLWGRFASARSDRAGKA